MYWNLKGLKLAPSSQVICLVDIDLLSIQIHFHGKDIYNNLFFYSITCIFMAFLWLYFLVNFLIPLLLGLEAACSGAWKATWALFYNQEISWTDSSNEPAEVCLKCCWEVFKLRWSYGTSAFGEWDAWLHWRKWASSGSWTLTFH